MDEINEYYTFQEYIKNNSLTPSEEDYIEMIYRLSLKGEEIKVSEISKYLNIKPPSVTKMIKKLDQKNLITYQKYDNVELSEIGKILGEKLLKRHNTVYRFLEIVGVENCIHEETEKIEHMISGETLIKIHRFINFIDENNDVLEKYKDYMNKI
ncbi:MAG: metal-dependent transcriptional regulator [Romboutsia sp.]